MEFCPMLTNADNLLKHRPWYSNTPPNPWDSNTLTARNIRFKIIKLSEKSRDPTVKWCDLCQYRISLWKFLMNVSVDFETLRPGYDSERYRHVYIYLCPERYVGNNLQSSEFLAYSGSFRSCCKTHIYQIFGPYILRMCDSYYPRCLPGRALEPKVRSLH